MINDRGRILCNGAGCMAEADVQATLHPWRSGSPPGAQQVFVADGGERHHYCPACLVSYVESLHKQASPE